MDNDVISSYDTTSEQKQKASEALSKYISETGDTSAYVKVQGDKFAIHSKTLAGKQQYVPGSSTEEPVITYRSSASKSGSGTMKMGSNNDIDSALKIATNEFIKKNPNKSITNVHYTVDDRGVIKYSIESRDRRAGDELSYQYNTRRYDTYEQAESAAKKYTDEFKKKTPDAEDVQTKPPHYNPRTGGYDYGVTYSSRSQREQYENELKQNKQKTADFWSSVEQKKKEGYDVKVSESKQGDETYLSYTAKPGQKMQESLKEQHRQEILSKHPDATDIQIFGAFNEKGDYEVSSKYNLPQTPVKSPFVTAILPTSNKKIPDNSEKFKSYITKDLYVNLAGISDTAATTSVKMFGIKPDEEIFSNTKSSSIQKGAELLATRSSQMITETPRMVGTLAVAFEHMVREPKAFAATLPASAIEIAQTPVKDPAGFVAMIGVGGLIGHSVSKIGGAAKSAASKTYVRLASTPEEYTVFKNVVSAQKTLGSMKPRALKTDLDLSRVTTLGKKYGETARRAIISEPESKISIKEGGTHRIFGRTTEINQMSESFIKPRGYTGDVDLMVAAPKESAVRIAQTLGKEFKVSHEKNVQRVGLREKSFDIHELEPTDPNAYDIAHPPTSYEVPKAHKLTNVNLLRQEALPSQIVRKGLSLQGEFEIIHPFKNKFSKGPITSDIMKTNPVFKGGIEDIENVGLRLKYRYGPKEHRIKDALDYMNEMSAEIYERKQLNVKYEPPVKLKTAFESVKSYYSKPEVYIKYLEGKKFGEAISKMEFGKPMSSPVKSTIKTGRLFTSSDFYGKSPSMISSLLASPSFASSFNIKSNIKSPISSKSSSNKSSSRKSSSSKSSSMLSPSRISSVSSILSSSKISSRSLISGSSKSSSSRSSSGSSKSSSSRSSSGTSSSSRSSSFSSSFGSSGSSFGSSYGSSGSSFIGGSGSSSIRYPYGKPSVGSDYQRYKYKKGSSLYGFTEKIKTFTPSQALGIKSESIKFKKLKIRGVKLK